MSAPEAFLLANAAATWFMCGVIWLVQLVHYPLFRCYDRHAFAATMLEHQRRTGRVVFPAMLVELVTALLLPAYPPPGVPASVAWVGVALVGLWAFPTALAQVPLHGQLAGGFDADLHRRLVRSNWVRTAAWSLRGVLCGVMVASGYDGR